MRAKSFEDYEGLLRRYVRPRLGAKTLAAVSAFDIQILHRDLLARNLSGRSVRYTHAVLRSALQQAVRWNLILATLQVRQSLRTLSVDQLTSIPDSQATLASRSLPTFSDSLHPVV